MNNEDDCRNMWVYLTPDNYMHILLLDDMFEKKMLEKMLIKFKHLKQERGIIITNEIKSLYKVFP
jgi:hypothetical protein